MTLKAFPKWDKYFREKEFDSSLNKDCNVYNEWGGVIAKARKNDPVTVLKSKVYLTKYRVIWNKIECYISGDRIRKPPRERGALTSLHILPTQIFENCEQEYIHHLGSDGWIFNDHRTLAACVTASFRANPNVSAEINTAVEVLFDIGYTSWGAIDERVLNELGRNLGEILYGWLGLKLGIFKSVAFPSSHSNALVDSYVLTSTGWRGISSKYDRGAKSCFFTNIMSRTRFIARMRPCVMRDLREHSANYERHLHSLYSYVLEELGYSDPIQVCRDVCAGNRTDAVNTLLAHYSLQDTTLITSTIVKDVTSRLVACLVSQSYMNDIMRSMNVIQVVMKKTPWHRGHIQFSELDVSESRVVMSLSKSAANDPKASQGTIAYELKSDDGYDLCEDESSTSWPFKCDSRDAPQRNAPQCKTQRDNNSNQRSPKQSAGYRHENEAPGEGISSSKLRTIEHLLSHVH